MAIADPRAVVGTAPTAPPLLDIVIPVHDGAPVVARSIERLTDHLAAGFPFTWRITVVDDASTDGTWGEASKVAALHDGVEALRLDAEGRGRALRAAWSRSDATIVASMDVDLSTDLQALLPLIAPLVSGHSDVDEAGFFDTELLLLAERNGLRITEIPVDWVDHPDHPDRRAHAVRTALDDLRGVVRVALAFWTGHGDVDLAGLDHHRRPPPAGSGGELVSFATVGALSTVAYVALFLALCGPLGDHGANAVALTATMVASTTAYRAWTFGRPPAAHRPSRRRVWARAAAVHLAGLGLTTAAIVAAGAVDGATTPSLMVPLLAASVLSTALRFLLMPAWVFRTAEPAGSATPPAPARGPVVTRR